MRNSKLKQIAQETADFRDMFRNDAVRHVKEGTWFTIILRRVLDVHAKKNNAAYFKKKYPGLDNQRIAKRLVKSSANHMLLAGGIAGGAASAAQLSTPIAGPGAVVALGATLLGEIAYITYYQLKLIYDLSVVLDAELDREDPEDLMVFFWYAMGVNLWQDAGNLLLKAGPRGAEYLGRKVLRDSLRKSMQGMAKRFGGTVLAKKITERSVLKLFVPGVNVPIAAGVNYAFTRTLGSRAIKRLNHRGVAIHILKQLQECERCLQLLALPTIFHVGISDEAKSISSRCVEMQAMVSRRLCIIPGEEHIIDNLLELEFEAFVEKLGEVVDGIAADSLVDIAVCSYLTSQADNSIVKLTRCAKALRQDDIDSRIRRISKKLQVD